MYKIREWAMTFNHYYSQLGRKRNSVQSPLQGMWQMLHLRDPEDFKGQPWSKQAGGEEWRLQKGDRCSCPRVHSSIDWNEAKVRSSVSR